MDFVENLKDEDSQIFNAIEKEKNRQSLQIELIASENFVSKAVLEAQGSILTNKYAEGYPSHRYYGGCEFVDIVENLAIERAKKLFDCKYANVQPHSGSQANMAVYMALLCPCDTILGMGLKSGGHLTHGAKVSMSGKWLKSVSYGVCHDTGLIDYDEVERLAKEHQPKLIIAGGSAYPRAVDFSKFRKIADEVGAYLMVDMAHFAGLVAGKVHENPLKYADVVTTTTHKTLRGPRGGMILTDNEEIAKKINSAIFPGTQGGPLMHVIAAKAVCFKEDLSDEFKHYAAQVVKNAKAFGAALQKHGFNLVSGGTDTHLLLIDLQNKNLTGKEVVEALELAGITCNKNSVPFDPLPATITSGIRVGTPACTTRGFCEPQFEQIADWISEIVDALQQSSVQEIIPQIKAKVEDLCRKFPIYK